MVKEPRAGRVKTRLAADIGTVPAAWWFRHQTARLLRRLADPHWQVILAISPDIACLTRAFPASIRRMGQGRGDLGQRMARLIRTAPPGPVVLIGADIPGITKSHIRGAFTALGSHDAAFGPAADGGFWMTGFARRRPLPPKLFAHVRWAGPHALADSLATLGGQNLALTDRLADIDTAADLAAHRAAFPQDAPRRT